VEEKKSETLKKNLVSRKEKEKDRMEGDSYSIGKMLKDAYLTILSLGTVATLGLIAGSVWRMKVIVESV
jgi:hypothetical protein